MGFHTRYEITLKRSAAKSLERLPRRDLERVAMTIDKLAGNPRPPGSEKLVGEDCLWRIRCGHYRIIYTIDDAVLVILVVRIGHRKDIYR